VDGKWLSGVIVMPMRKEKKTRRQKRPPPVAQPGEGYTPRTTTQKAALDVIASNAITFILGPAGTGKTHLASGYAVQQLLGGAVENIVITRPSVATEQLGYLPGSAEEKVGPYLVPFFDAIERIAGKRGHTKDRERVGAAVKIAPLAYLRGRTFHRSIMIFDEAQNATFSQLKLFLTRIGTGSKIIVTGDADQSDLPRSERRLIDVMQRLAAIKGVGVVEFKSSDIVRHPIIENVLKELER
jgi:phosphate starvation-inducible protein PhoH and related proteins